MFLQNIFRKYSKINDRPFQNTFFEIKVKSIFYVTLFVYMAKLLDILHSTNIFEDVDDFDFEFKVILHYFLYFLLVLQWNEYKIVLTWTNMPKTEKSLLMGHTIMVLYSSIIVFWKYRRKRKWSKSPQYRKMEMKAKLFFFKLLKIINLEINTKT